MTLGRRVIKASPPETIEQVHTWDRTKLRYVRAGLCHKCAAQAAWGHQAGAGGWLPLHPPCPSCVPSVASFLLATPNQLWRRSLRTHNPPLSAVPHSRATAAAAPVL